MSLEYYVVDAFTSELYKGNQAAVVIFLEGDPRSQDKAFQQNIAREFVYSETAFLQRLSSLPDESPKFSLRWFTPITEFCLCGHATLASSFILFNSSLIYEITNIIQFETLSGTLTAQRMTDGRIKLNFPADSSTVSGNMEVEVIKTIEKAMSKVAPGFELSLVEMRAGKLGYIIEIGHWIRLKGLKMDMSAFRDIGLDGMFIFTQQTTAGPSIIESRVFDPVEEIMEDPVTGSAHCMLAPYWISKFPEMFENSTFQARQVSARGGELEVTWLKQDDRVLLQGFCVSSMSGRLHV